MAIIDPYTQLRGTGALDANPVNYTPLQSFLDAPKYVDAYSDAFLEGSKYSDFNAMAGGKKTNKSSSVPINKYSKQGLTSDVRHTLGSAAGKEAIIDWASSNLGIDPYGKFANVIGNVGITGATALEEMPDAWRSFKQALGEGDYGAITSGDIFAQPWEDVQANLNAWGIPYGATLEQKKSYVPQLRFKQQQLMNRRKQNMQKKIRQAEAAQQVQQVQQVQQNIQTYGNRDRPNTGMNVPGGGKGQSPTGGDVAGTPFVRGGRASYFDGGLASLWLR